MARKTPSLLRQPAVLAKTGKSRSGLYRDIAAGRFPKPIKIGEAHNSTSLWVSDEVDAYVESIIKAGREQPAK